MRTSQKNNFNGWNMEGTLCRVTEETSVRRVQNSPSCHKLQSLCLFIVHVLMVICIHCGFTKLDSSTMQDPSGACVSAVLSWDSSLPGACHVFLLAELCQCHWASASSVCVFHYGAVVSLPEQMNGNFTRAPFLPRGPFGAWKPDTNHNVITH